MLSFYLKMQNVSRNDNRDKPSEVNIVEVGQTSVKPPPSQSMDKQKLLFPANFISDLSHSDEDEASEVRK